MKQNAFLRKIMAPLERTPLHPQWLVFRNSRRTLRSIGERCSGAVLDIGAGARRIENHLPPDCKYISLDYMETAVDWYGTRPHVFGDGQCLPFEKNTIDTVLLLDVLEHLPEPDKAIAEAWRVLRPGGTLHITVPFMYPLHDAPYDFQRWTVYGIRHVLERSGYEVVNDTSLGNPIESAALLTNLALSKATIDWIHNRSVLIALCPLIILAIPAVNILGWLFGMDRRTSVGFMPYSLRFENAKQ